ncbi:MAG: carbohydrate-binding protein [Verrucomicrobia bacterium]|nr:carbohydrate-binding protein [Verrucomicrobiota bacterium]
MKNRLLQLLVVIGFSIIRAKLMKRIFYHSLILLGLTITSQSVKAGLAYPAPPGGWTYTLTGDAAAFGTGVFDSLDGTWNRSIGTSEWDGSPLGPTIATTNKPGGVGTYIEGDLTYPGSNVTYLRIQDTGNPPQYSTLTNNGCDGCSLGGPSNRKIAFVHDMTDEGAPDTFLDDGFTITFRARVPTPAKTTQPLDPLYPNGESGSGPQPYPAGGDGYLIADDSNGFFNPHQAAIGKLGFSLVTSNDTLGGLTAVPKANFQGLMVNGLNGTAPNNNIDFNESPAQFLPLDPTDWNEFWIVVQRDPSALGTHVLFVYTNGSVNAQIFHVTAASASGQAGGGGPNHIEMGMTQTAQSGCVDIDFLAYKFAAVFPPGSGGLPPSITDVSPNSPSQGNLFWPISSNVTFTATSFGSNTIASSGVNLILNGVNVGGGLIVTGGGTSNVTATYNGLVNNTVYSGRITVQDSAGQLVSFPLLFDTFTEPSALVIEAEDYNTNNGNFMDNPAPNGYANAVGTPEVDFHDVTPSTLGAYRGSDAVDTALSADTARAKFTAASANDYDVASVEQGEWQNYTRTFPTGKYDVYLRFASTVAQSVRLDLVTGDRTQPNQTTAFLGTFPVPNSGGAHTYARLRDAFGSNLVVNLSGVQTLRLTAPDASLDLQENYLVLVPLVSAVTNPPVVGFTSPAPNSTNGLPDALIVIGIVNRDTAVVTNTINYQFDAVDVTGSAIISSNAAGASITYQPPSQLTLNSLHTNRLVFGDGTRLFTNTWSFRVANLPVLLAAWATAPGSGLTNGFNVAIHYHEEAQDFLFLNNATRAEDQVGYLLNDVATGQPYVNNATGCDPVGIFSETLVINYSNDSADRGSFPGDGPFPCIGPGARRHIAMAVTANLELSAGLHRFGVRRNDGFKLSAGPYFSRAGAFLTLGIFETPNFDNGTATTEFDFMVQANGVYPFRLIFFQDAGPCDIEWYSVDRTTGVSTLINAASGASVKAYLDRPVLPLTSQLILNPQVAGTNVTFSYPTLFGYTYYVDYKDAIADSWTQGVTGFAGDGSTHTFSAPANATSKRFYRVRAQ